MQKKSNRIISFLLSLTTMFNIITTPVMAADLDLDIDTNHKIENPATMEVPVTVYPIGDESFFKINDDGSISYADREVDPDYKAVPSSLISGSEHNKNNVAYGMYATDDGSLHVVPMLRCFWDADKNAWMFDHATKEGATVSVEVDTATNDDPTMTTKFYIYFEDGVGPGTTTTEKLVNGLATTDPRVTYKVNVETKGVFQIKATVPMYVCMYGYRGTGNVVTPTSDAYALRNFSTQDTSAEGRIADIAKVTSFTQILDTENTDDKIFSIAYAEGGEPGSGTYTWWYSDPAEDVNFDKDYYTAYTEISQVDTSVDNIKANGKTYVVYEIVTGRWRFEKEENLENGILSESIDEIDSIHPLIEDLIVDNWNYGTYFKVGDQAIGKVNTNLQQIRGLPIRVTNVQAEPSTWVLVDEETEFANLKRGELIMEIAPDANEDSYFYGTYLDGSAIDLADCSAPLDISTHNWLLKAPVVSKGDIEVKSGNETILPLDVRALMAGGNVNDEGCTPVVKVSYTITPILDPNDTFIVHPLDAGLYETGTTILVYEWSKLIEDGHITIENGVITDADIPVSGDLVISSQISSIAANAFADNSPLTGVTIPNGVTSIGDNAFSGCPYVAKLVIPASVTSIGANGLPVPGMAGANGTWYDVLTGQVFLSEEIPLGVSATYVAVVSPTVYEITYNANGGIGSMVNTSHMVGIKKLLAENQFRRNGYTFAGWNTAPDGSGDSYSDNELVRNLSTVHGDVVTLYAMWEANEYTYNIKYVSTTGVQISTGVVKGNFNTTTTVAPKTFAGYTSPASQSVTFDSTNAKTITFTYTPIEYTITYNLNGGNATNTTKFTVETPTFTLNNPTKSGYTFAGWTGANGNTPQTSVSIAKGSISNRTYTANWAGYPYTVKFDANGGSGNMNNQSFVYGTAQNLTANAFTRTGYTFKGWATSAARANAGTVDYTDKQSVNNLTATANGTVTLYAVWTEGDYTYNIKYVSKSGVQLGTATVTGKFGSSTTVNPKAFDGYMSPVAQSVTFDSTTTKTITFTYTPVEYTIGYVLNNGTVSPVNPTTYTIETPTFTLNNPTRTGFIFDGWTGSNGNTVQKNVSIAKGSTGNKTFTANWTGYTYTVKFNANGGSGSMNNQNFAYGTAQNLTANAFTRTGYTFKGWATSSTGSVVHVDKASVNNLTSTNGGTVNLYAVWEANDCIYEVNYLSSTGVAIGTGTVTGKHGTTQSVSPKAFDGYSSPAAQSVSFDFTTTKTITFTYTPIEYTISYNLNSGSVATANPTKYTVETPTFTLNNPTRTGYIFAGWTGSNGNTAVTSVKVTKGSTGNKSFTANWNVNSYALNINPNGGYRASDGSTDIVTVTKSFGATENISERRRTGYTLTGYVMTNANNGSTTDLGGATFTFDSSNKTGVFKQGTVPITLTAQWSVNSYTTIFNPNGGYRVSDNNANAVSYSYNYGRTDNISERRRTGYTLTGYAITNTATGSTTDIGGATASFDSTTKTGTYKQGAANVTVSCNWTPNTYTVVFDANGGSGSMSNLSMTYGTAKNLTANAFTRTNYNFKGWATSSTGSVVYADKASVNNLTPTNGATITLYAVWEGTEYTISYNANGGSGTMSSHAANIGSYIKIKDNEFTAPRGQRFVGWTTKADGTNDGYGWSSNGLGWEGTWNYIDGQYGITNRNLVLYAMWTPLEYTITYAANGGTGVMDSHTVKYGGSIKIKDNEFTAPAGHKFGGWTTRTDNVSDGYGWSTSSNTGWSGTWNYIDGQYGITNQKLELYAIWIPLDYTYNIKYVSKSGVQLDTATVTGKFGSSTTVSPKAITGYTSPANQSVTFDSTTAKTITFTYTPIEYTIGYTLNNGSVSPANPTKYTIETTTFTLTNPTRTGYTFSGWTGTNGTTAQTTVSIAKGSTGNRTYTANWTLNTYVVKFNANGGSGTMNNQNFTYGTAQNLTANAFTRTGYTFKGWATSGTGSAVYADKSSVSSLTSTNGATVNLYAVWEPNIYKVTLDNQSATSAGTTAYWYQYNTTKTVGGVTAYYYSDSTCATPLSNGYIISVPTRTGYTFGGYYTGANGSGTQYVDASGNCVNNLYKAVASDITLYAKWTANSYTVKFNANGGSGTMNNLSMTYGTAQNLTANAFTRTGYTFLGWSTSSSATAATYTDKQSVNNLTATSGGTVNLYAVWKINTYTVKFNANGGSGTMNDLSMTYGTAKNLTANAFIRTGYAFKGWSTSSSATSATYTDKQSVNNLTATANGTVTLYAVWQKVEYTISYTLNSGSVATANPTTYYVDTATFTLTNPTRTGYTFTGWTGSNGDTPQKTVSIAIGSTGNKTYTANWTANTYTVVYHPNGGSLLDGSVSINSTNLVPYPFTQTTRTDNGITYTDNGNGKITANGTATATSFFNVWGASNNLTFPAGTYQMSGAPNTGSDVRFCNNSTNYSDYGSGHTFTLTESTAISFKLRIASGVKLSNAVFTPSIKKISNHTYGTAKALDANAFVRNNYTFQGWATSAARANAGTVDYTNKQSVNNLTATANGTVTLYAVWKATSTQFYPGKTVTTQFKSGSITVSNFGATRTGYTESYVMLSIPVDLTNISTLKIKGSAKNFAGVCLSKSTPQKTAYGCLQVASSDAESETFGRIWQKGIWDTTSISIDESINVSSYSGTYYVIACIYGSNVTTGESTVSVSSVIGYP